MELAADHISVAGTHAPLLMRLAGRAPGTGGRCRRTLTRLALDLAVLAAYLGGGKAISTTTAFRSRTWSAMWVKPELSR